MEKSSLLLSTSTEKVADITNTATHSHEEFRPCPIEALAAKLDDPLVPTYLSETLCTNSNSRPSTPLVETLEPALDATVNQKHPPINLSLP